MGGLHRGLMSKGRARWRRCANTTCHDSPVLTFVPAAAAVDVCLHGDRREDRGGISLALRHSNAP
jgi:hypothetical protein